MAAKRLVVSNNFVSRTPFKLNFGSRETEIEPKIAKLTNRALFAFYLLTCGVVDLRSSDALRRKAEYDYAQN